VTETVGNRPRPAWDSKLMIPTFLLGLTYALKTVQPSGLAQTEYRQKLLVGI